MDGLIPRDSLPKQQYLISIKTKSIQNYSITRIVPVAPRNDANDNRKRNRADPQSAAKNKLMRHEWFNTKPESAKT